MPELVLADGSRVVADALLRRLPGRREVYAGVREGQAVVAKVYLDPRRAAVHAQRESAGLTAFAAAGVAAPEVLYDGRDRAERPVVVVRRIVAATSLAERWENADSAQREGLLRDMMALLAAHHAAGICQKDLHPGNFLVAHDGIYSIDGDAVDVQRRPLGRRPSLRNLALLCAQFTPDTDPLSLSVSSDYARARDWPAATLRRRLPAAIDAARLRRWRQYRDKLYRDCSAIAHRPTPAGHGYVVRAHIDTLTDLLADPDGSCPADPAARLKNGNTATVWRTDAGGLPVVIKRYNVKGRSHAARMLLREGRASRSWRNAHMLAFFGIATPPPLAMIRARRALAGQPGYLLTRELQGEGLADWMRRHRDDAAALQRIAGQVGALFARLRALRIAHGDTKATNFLVADDRVHVIDLDAMKRYRNRLAFARARRRDVRRFLANWRDDAPIRDLLRTHVDIPTA